MAITSRSSLSTAATYEHAYFMPFSTCLQSIFRDDKPREPDRCTLASPRPTSRENSGARNVSPGDVHQGSIVWRGYAMSASMLLVPSGASSPTGSTRAGTPYKRAAPLPSYTCVISASCASVAGVSCTCDISAPDTSSAESPITGASWCTSVDREELRGRGLGRVTHTHR
jgi:hypothetical protein